MGVWGHGAKPNRPLSVVLHADFTQNGRKWDGPLEGAGCASLGTAPMGDDDEIYLHVTYASHVDMDEAFCARMRMAIAAGLESVPIGVITTPGTKKPKYVLAEPLWPLASPLGAMDL